MLRESAARLLFKTGVTQPRRRSHGRLSVATFHRVLPEQERRDYPYPGLAVTPQELDALLAYMTQHFDCGPLATQHQRFLDDDKASRPLLAVTFDDGQYDNYLHARPVLARHSVKASFFIPVEAVEQQSLLWHDRLGFAVRALRGQGARGRDHLVRILTDAGMHGAWEGNVAQNVVRGAKKLNPDARLRMVQALVDASGAGATPDYARLMTFDELAALAADGHEIGSHSMTHSLMPECNDQALNYETAESRRGRQTRLSRAIESFCFPNGNCDDRTAGAVAQAGYHRAVSTQWGDNGKDADRFRLRRFDMDASRVKDSNGNFLPAMLAFRMSGLYPGLKSLG